MSEKLSEFEKAVMAQSLVTPTGVKSPTCCGKAMADNGGCSDGCCDDFKCADCGKTLRIEWPD